MRPISYFLTHPSQIVLSLLNHFGTWLPDEPFLKYKFRLEMGKPLNLEKPETFQEKLQWLKLHDHRQEYSTLVDKYEVKTVISSLIGEEYVIPTLGVWDRFEDIDFDSLPDRFVLKTTHGGGNTGVVICKDKSSFDREDARRKIAKSMKSDIYKTMREWPYKNVRHRIIAEEYIEQTDGALNDFKFFCFDGRVDCVMDCIDRNTGQTKFYFFDRDWNLLRLNKRGVEAAPDFTLPKPEGIDKMFDLAAKLSVGRPFTRVDLYNVDGRIYFGEMTFFPDGGFDKNILVSTDERWGKMLNIPLDTEN